MTADRITLEDFIDLGKPRAGRVVVRCECGADVCAGWAEVEPDEPWGLRDYEALPDMQGPLPLGY